MEKIGGDVIVTTWNPELIIKGRWILKKLERGRRECPKKKQIYIKKNIEVSFLRIYALAVWCLI